MFSGLQRGCVRGEGVPELVEKARERRLSGLPGTAEAGPEALELSRSSVSRRYSRATARKLEALQERRLAS